MVAKVEWHCGELFPRVGFIVTNLRWKHSNVVKFYNKRGTAEQWIKEGKEVKNDLHYSVDGYKTLGKRFSEKAIELIKNRPNKAMDSDKK